MRIHKTTIKSDISTVTVKFTIIHNSKHWPVFKYQTHGGRKLELSSNTFKENTVWHNKVICTIFLTEPFKQRPDFDYSLELMLCLSNFWRITVAFCHFLVSFTINRLFIIKNMNRKMRSWRSNLRYFEIHRGHFHFTLHAHNSPVWVLLWNITLN